MSAAESPQALLVLLSASFPPFVAARHVFGSTNLVHLSARGACSSEGGGALGGEVVREVLALTCGSSTTRLTPFLTSLCFFPLQEVWMSLLFERISAPSLRGGGGGDGGA